MTTKQHSLSVTFLLFVLPSFSLGFASWFVERSLSCWTFLQPKEIVMNNEILPVTSSRYPDSITIQVWTKQDDETYKKLETAHELKEDGTSIVYLDSASDETNNENDDDTGSEIMEYKLTLEYPMNMELGDLQYVMESSLGGEFVYAENKGGVGCDGRRAYGRRKTEIFLEVDTGSKVFEDDDKADTATEGLEEEAIVVTKGGVEVWAGWATEHEAVTLTPHVRFQFQPELTPEEENLVEHIALDKDLSSAEQDAELNRHMDELLTEQRKIAMERMHQMRESVVLKHDHERIKNIQIGGVPTNSKDKHDYYGDHRSFAEEKKKMNRIFPPKANDKAQNNHNRHQHLREKNKKYDSNSSFSLEGFFKACSFLLLFIIIIICIITSKKNLRKNGKGRRDL